jgi:hypothetical protein
MVYRSFESDEWACVIPADQDRPSGALARGAVSPLARARTPMVMSSPGVFVESDSITRSS